MLERSTHRATYPYRIFSVNTVSKFVRHERHNFLRHNFLLIYTAPHRSGQITPGIKTIARLQIECETKLDLIKTTDLSHYQNAHTVNMRVIFCLLCFEYGVLSALLRISYRFSYETYSSWTETRGGTIVDVEGVKFALSLRSSFTKNAIMKTRKSYVNPSSFCRRKPIWR